MPKRIQRKRTKGWRMPPNTVYVGRPSQYGNPYKLRHGRTRQECVDAFRDYLIANQQSAARWRLRVFELEGKDLVCWCPIDQPCHADVLLEIANQ